MTVNSTRIHGAGWREAVALAHEVIGHRLMARLGHVQYVLGADPVFIGLHSHDVSEAGFSLRRTAHCAFPCHIAGPADRRVATVVMPVPYSSMTTVHAWTAHTLVHELGHALHEAIRFDHVAAPVTEYARSNVYEAFAEAFTAWCWPGNGYGRPDAATQALFWALAS